MMHSDEFGIRSEWEPTAKAIDPQKMASLIYVDLKKHMHGGIVPPPDAISHMLTVIKEILYRDYEWDISQLEILQNEFQKLNKYYPQQEESDGMMLGMIPQGQLVLIPNMPMQQQSQGQQSQGQQSQGQQIQPQQLKKKKLSSVLWLAGSVLIKLAIAWLAFFGLIILLG